MTTNELEHAGTPRHSGRYPWGSGEDGYQRGGDFARSVRELRKGGMSEIEVAELKGMSINRLRSAVTIDRTYKRQEDAAEALKLKDKQWSNSAIAKKMGISDHTVADLLNPVIQARADMVVNTADMLRTTLEKKRFTDVGSGVEQSLGISRTKLNASISMLLDEGCMLHTIYVPQVGTGKYTEMKVLALSDVTETELNHNRAKIDPPKYRSNDGGLTHEPIPDPVMLSRKRILVRYGQEGGSDKDGIIELRRNVPDISLGNSRYAQVRVGVDGTHYLKGVAMYSDKMPDGVDVVFNTNKKSGTPDGDVFKPIKKGDDLKMDPDLPFGSLTRPKKYTDSDGVERVSPLNIVYEEGEWAKWSTKLSSQFLSKQPPSLIKQQLDLSLASKKAEFENLVSLTNPAVKQRLLSGDGGFADDCDSAAVHLKAAALPRAATHVILPFPGMKENEVYAPNFNDGERVVLVRHPHGGIFEIPELIVNNKYPEAKQVIDRAKDAVGIHPKVAQKLSGADFDGDTVIVIPNDRQMVKTSPAIKSLMEFAPKELYQDKSLPKMTDRIKQMKMGDASNLIADMTLRGANPDGPEIVRAVKYSMVVIDAQKHSLDYKRAALEYNIPALKAKYQGGPTSGASTLITKAGSDYRIPDRKLGVTDPITGRRLYVDPTTGQKLYRDTNQSYDKPVTRYKTIDGVKTKVMVLKDGSVKEQQKMTPDDYNNLKTVSTERRIKTTKMDATSDAFTLSSGLPVENIYARYANELKTLANKARLVGTQVEFKPYSRSAKDTYAKEVDVLQSKLNLAYRNKPIERKAQLLANDAIYVKKQANKDMTPEELKKLKGLQLTRARLQTGAKKQKIEITDAEWEAIQAGAITKNTLFQILANTDLDALKARAMPRADRTMSPTNLARAKSMVANGYTQSEIANALGVSTSVLTTNLN